jgi:hypothetical protein
VKVLVKEAEEGGRRKLGGEGRQEKRNIRTHQKCTDINQKKSDKFKHQH